MVAGGEHELVEEEALPRGGGEPQAPGAGGGEVQAGAGRAGGIEVGPRDGVVIAKAQLRHRHEVGALAGQGDGDAVAGAGGIGTACAQEMDAVRAGLADFELVFGETGGGLRPEAEAGVKGGRLPILHGGGVLGLKAEKAVGIAKNRRVRRCRQQERRGEEGGQQEAAIQGEDGRDHG
jgi:hypothetical protein